MLKGIFLLPRVNYFYALMRETERETHTSGRWWAKAIAWYSHLINIPYYFTKKNYSYVHFCDIITAHAWGETRGDGVAENSNVGWRLRKFRVFGVATLYAMRLVSRKLAVVQDYASRRLR